MEVDLPRIKPSPSILEYAYLLQRDIHAYSVHMHVLSVFLDVSSIWAGFNQEKLSEYMVNIGIREMRMMALK